MGSHQTTVEIILWCYATVHCATLTLYLQCDFVFLPTVRLCIYYLRTCATTLSTPTYAYATTVAATCEIPATYNTARLYVYTRHIRGLTVRLCTVRLCTVRCSQAHCAHEQWLAQKGNMFSFIVE